MSEHIARQPINYALYCDWFNACLFEQTGFALECSRLELCSSKCFFIVPQRARDLGNSVCVWESKVLTMLPERQGEAYLCVSKDLGDLFLRHKTNQTSDASWPREWSWGQSPLSCFIFLEE